MANKSINKLEVFQVALEFVSLSYGDKFRIGKHFKEMNEDMLNWDEAALEGVIWHEGNTSVENFNYLSDLVDLYAKADSR